MKFILFIHSMIWKLTWKNKLCKSCSNLECVSNFSPCYQCNLGSNYEYENKEEAEEIMTQLDRIHSLSLEDMLDFIENEAGGGCRCCAYYDDTLKCSYNYNGYKCREGIKEWLKQEVK